MGLVGEGCYNCTGCGYTILSAKVTDECIERELCPECKEYYDNEQKEN